MARCQGCIFRHHYLNEARSSSEVSCCPIETHNETFYRGATSERSHEDIIFIVEAASSFCTPHPPHSPPCLLVICFCICIDMQHVIGVCTQRERIQQIRACSDGSASLNHNLTMRFRNEARVDELSGGGTRDLRLVTRSTVSVYSYGTPLPLGGPIVFFATLE
jgi:hypothetical protein